MKQTYGEFIRSLRISKGLTLEEVSRILGHKSSSYLLSVEKGIKTLSPQKACKIAEVLGVSRSDLLRKAFAQQRDNFINRVQRLYDPWLDRSGEIEIVMEEKK